MNINDYAAGKRGPDQPLTPGQQAILDAIPVREQGWNRSQPAVLTAAPEGWKLVPVRPTAEMLAATDRCHDGKSYPQDWVCGPRAMRATEYAAMLKAAPPAPHAAGSQEPTAWMVTRLNRRGDESSGGSQAQARPKTYTEDELQRRLKWAREAGAAKAWADLMARFSSKQRQHLANLMAHKWTISAIEMQSSLSKGDKADERLEAVMRFPSPPPTQADQGPAA